MLVDEVFVDVVAVRRIVIHSRHVMAEGSHAAQTKKHEAVIFNNNFRAHLHMLPMHVDSHGVKNRAGKILGAEAGQDVDGNGGQERQQFDFKPECDEIGVV